MLIPNFLNGKIFSDIKLPSLSFDFKLGLESMGNSSLNSYVNENIVLSIATILATISVITLLNMQLKQKKI